MWYLLLIVLAASTPLSDLAFRSAQLACPYANNRGLGCPMQTNGLSQTSPPTLPGRIGIGWNPVTRQVGLPVLQVNYTQEMWNGFVLPEGLTFTPLDVTKEFTKDYTFNTIDQWYASKSLMASGFLGGSFSLDEDVTNIYANFFGDDCSMVISQVINKVFSLATNLSTSWTQDSVFAAAEAYLPVTYDPTLYQELIDYWGTHVIMTTNFGGLAEQRAIVKTCAYNTVAVTNEAQLELLKTLYPQEYKQYNLDTNYLQRRRAQSVDLFGGDPTISNWTARISTLIKAPALLDFTTISLDKFILDPQKRANVVKALQTYITTASSKQTSTLQTAHQQFLGGRTAYFSVGAVTNGYNNPITSCNFGSYYSSLTLGALGSTHTFCKMGLISVGSMYCSRDGNGNVVAEVANTKGTVAYGSPVREGCSIAVIGNTGLGDNIYSACCLSCVPVVTPVESMSSYHFTCGCEGF